MLIEANCNVNFLFKGMNALQHYALAIGNQCKRSYNPMVSLDSDIVFKLFEAKLDINHGSQTN